MATGKGRKPRRGQEGRGNGDVAPPGREECGWKVGGGVCGWVGGGATGRTRQEADGERRGGGGRAPWSILALTGGGDSGRMEAGSANGRGPGFGVIEKEVHYHPIG